MSNKTRLETNNTNLQSVLTTVQGLPKVNDVKHGLYAWKKCSVQKELAETTKSNVHISTGASGGASYTYIYADSYSVDLDTGIFTLNNPQTHAGQVMYPPSVLKGKYIIAVDASIGSTYTPKTSGKELWFIPSDATLTGGTGYSSANTVTSYKVNTLKSVLDFVVSDDPTAYPDGGTQGGYWYEKVVEGVDLSTFGITKVAVDEIVPTSDIPSSADITHSLGDTPKYLIIATGETISSSTTRGYVKEYMAAQNIMVSFYLSSTYPSGTWGAGASHLSSTSFKLGTGGYLKSGVTYKILTMA